MGLAHRGLDIAVPHAVHNCLWVGTTLRKHDGCVPVAKSVKRDTRNSQPLTNGMQHLSADVLRPNRLALALSK